MSIAFSLPTTVTLPFVTALSGQIHQLHVSRLTVAGGMRGLLRPSRCDLSDEAMVFTALGAVSSASLPASLRFCLSPKL
ncbi:hypothetical protein JZ751_023797 [Albula glossodonta]|uniref:Uncharacterized protein n=1 Tax=Albula glossodonta TaxID=121402 RepID=A0A8T2NFR2_9TELE|nr:hypothetical protein JZ751_023797 [Albula glossodonta]